MTTQDFMTEVMQAIQGFGGLPWAGKVALIITLLIASMKVSVLDQLIWDKLGKLQAWMAPMLGLVAGIIAPLASGQPITLAGVFAYMSAGAGAVILHELLDTAKGIPGLGALWVSLIGVVEGALGGNPVGAQDAAKPIAAK